MTENVPTIRFPEGRPLWFSQFQDGPIWGLLEWRGSKFWYEFAGHQGAERVYDVFEIDPEDAAEEEWWFSRRREAVGGPCQFDSECRVVMQPWTADREAWIEIHEIEDRRGDPRYSRNQKVARFVWSP